MPDVPIRVLSGVEEAEYSAEGVLCGIPTADGILADIGGGSLELVRLDRGGTRGVSQTLSLGVIRLAERAGGDPARARAIAEADLATVPWLAEGANRDLYLVGGAWRALARIHMAQTGYPLQMVHHYTIGREEARDLTGVIAGAGSPRAGTTAGHVAPAHRRPAVCRGGAAARAACDRRAPRGVQRQRPARGLVHAAHAGAGPRAGPAAGRRARAGGPARPRSQPAAGAAGVDRPAVSRTKPARRAGCARRPAGCPISAATIIRSSAPSRRSCACCASPASAWTITRGPSSRWRSRCATRWTATPTSCVRRACCWMLPATHRAEVLGVALRLAYTLSAGTPDLLAGTGLRLAGSRLILRLQEDSGVFAGESVMRRLDRLAQAVGWRRRPRRRGTEAA